MYGMFAAAMGIWGIVQFSSRPMLGGVMLLLAIVFLIGASFNYSISKKFAQPGSERRE
jgi:hypothetical protein